MIKESLSQRESYESYGQESYGQESHASKSYNSESYAPEYVSIRKEIIPYMAIRFYQFSVENRANNLHVKQNLTIRKNNKSVLEHAFHILLTACSDIM